MQITCVRAGAAALLSSLEAGVHVHSRPPGPPARCVPRDSDPSQCTCRYRALAGAEA